MTNEIKNYFRYCISCHWTGKYIFTEVTEFMKDRNIKLNDFPKELAEAIEDGNRHGVSDELMVKGMVSIGNLLGRFVKPDSPEEALMREMWEIATDDEKNTLASLVLKIGKKRMGEM